MKSKIIKILPKKILIGMVVTSLIISWSFFEVNEAYATDFQPGEIIYVDDDNSGFENGSEYHPYNTIQEAVGDAEPGDTIFVDDGTYKENIDINKNNLTILSKYGAENTIVQAENSKDNVFEIKADYVKVDGFTAKGSLSSSAGILLDNASFCEISNNIASENTHGIRLNFSNNNTLANNTVSKNMVGILFSHSNDNILNNNIASISQYHGIFFLHSDNNTLTDNIVSKNYHDGILLFYSENNKIYHNNFINNRMNSELMNSAYNFFDNGYPSGGNYWSDYNETSEGCSDANNDGICDVPYELEDIYAPDDDYVTKEVYDNYPFIKENGWEVAILFCGNNICEQGETFENCYQDCAKQGIEKYFPYWKFSQDEKYHPTSFYFDQDADVENNREHYEDKKFDWAEPYVYAHTVEDENYFTIQYWMYMAFNHHRFAPIIPDHEHDFDATVFVVFNKNNLNQPIEVRFARHIYIGVYSWDEIGRINTTHPVAYVAQGSHGAYRCSDMGSLDVFNPGGLTYNPNFFNYYQVGNCVEEIKKEINGEQREFCKVENELIKGIEQNEPADGYWPKLFTGKRYGLFEKAPWHPNQDRWFQTRPEGFTSALEFGAACPVDLHIYDPEGNHIGMNYETNELEIQISEAIFQQKGEKQYIMIPNPIKGDYKVEIIGTGNGKYDFTMIASEDMKLIKKKEKKNIPIIKDEIQTFTVINLWESPKEIKQKAISDLNSIENNNKVVQKNIQKAIGLINKSLNEKYWINDLHLNQRQGRRVFNYGLRAVERLKALKKISKKLKINDPELFSSLKKAENKLAKADYLLAEIALNEAKNTEIKNDRFKKRIDKLIKKAEKELKKAKQKLEKNKPIKTITHSQKSWYYSNAAIKLADK